MTQRLTRHHFVRGRAARRAAELRLAEAIERELQAHPMLLVYGGPMGGGMAELRPVPDPVAAPAPPAAPPREERALPEKLDLRNAPSSMEQLAETWRGR